MDDGGSPLIGLIVFLILLLLDAVFYGFMAAVDNLNDSQIDRKVEEGNRKAIWLHRILDDPSPVHHILQSMMTFVSLIMGVYQGRLFGGLLVRHLLSPDSPAVLTFLCYVLSVVGSVFLLVSLGIIAPQKLAIRKSEKWAFGLAGFVHVLTIIFAPFGFLAEKLSNLVLRLFGMDPNENLDDVTAEEIISMVNEGHEQGVLEASEAEMIHNIFELDDKEARDIMTHRKHVVAVDGDMTLSEALSFMLEKNNSRFPVYREDIDNIIGIIHIKDAMLRSREEELLTLPIFQIPGLVREAEFIPETRNINSLFRSMQSQKNHMVIVVDEYGQTAGLVAMEDILEEIVGNILDEYDVEDTMIMRQADGSLLMKGMAPLSDVCEALKLSDEELADYDTLNGYLISLIDKIPEEHEQFEITDRGWLFEVQSVENKMIQTVRVTPVAEDASEETDMAAEEGAACQGKEISI